MDHKFFVLQFTYFLALKGYKIEIFSLLFVVYVACRIKNLYLGSPICSINYTSVKMIVIFSSRVLFLLPAQHIRKEWIIDLRKCRA